MLTCRTFLAYKHKVYRFYHLYNLYHWRHVINLHCLPNLQNVYNSSTSCNLISIYISQFCVDTHFHQYARYIVIAKADNDAQKKATMYKTVYLDTNRSLPLAQQGKQGEWI